MVAYLKQEKFGPRIASSRVLEEGVKRNAVIVNVDMVAPQTSGLTSDVERDLGPLIVHRSGRALEGASVVVVRGRVTLARASASYGQRWAQEG